MIWATAAARLFCFVRNGLLMAILATQVCGATGLPIPARLMIFHCLWWTCIFRWPNPRVTSGCRDPDSKVHEANMGPTWGRQDPGRSHVGPMNLAIWGLHQPGSGLEPNGTTRSKCHLALELQSKSVHFGPIILCLYHSSSYCPCFHP